MLETVFFPTKDLEEYDRVSKILMENQMFVRYQYVDLDLVRAKRIVTSDGQPMMFNCYPGKTNANLCGARLSGCTANTEFIEFEFTLDPKFQAVNDRSVYRIRVTKPS